MSVIDNIKIEDKNSSSGYQIRDIGAKAFNVSVGYDADGNIAAAASEVKNTKTLVEALKQCGGVELTQAEYNALPEEAKTCGITYYIADDFDLTNRKYENGEWVEYTPEPIPENNILSPIEEAIYQTQVDTEYNSMLLELLVN